MTAVWDSGTDRPISALHRQERRHGTVFEPKEPPSCLPARRLASPGEKGKCFLMKHKRISGADRRNSILEAACAVFSEHGYEGAKTQKIAAAAGVSEALVYRHFPSKLALYRAVLRQFIREQNASFEAIGLPEANTRSLVQTIKAFFQNYLTTRPIHQEQAVRILLDSLAGDGRYAELTYRRAIKLMLDKLERAMDAARAAGDLSGPKISAINAGLFMDHVGNLLAASRLGGRRSIPYQGDDEQLLRDAVWFCGRGLGLSEQALEKWYDSQPDDSAQPTQGHGADPHQHLRKTAQG